MDRGRVRATLKAWAQDGEITGVAESLGALKVTVEANPLLPKGGLEKSEGCEPLCVSKQLCPYEGVGKARGTHPTCSRPHSLQPEIVGRDQMCSPPAWPPGNPGHPAYEPHRPPSSCSPALQPDNTQTGSTSDPWDSPSVHGPQDVSPAWNSLCSARSPVSPLSALCHVSWVTVRAAKPQQACQSTSFNWHQKAQSPFPALPPFHMSHVCPF